jgi:glycine/D-amino acid oxidase-like deaminating enzyme
VAYHIIGGGPAGLMAAIALARMLITWMLGHPFKIIVYEASAFGGGIDDHGAALHSQLWQHSGALYATSQPWVTLGVQRSVSELMRLAPHAFTPTLALLIALQESGQPMLAEVLAALGLQHWPVPLTTVHTWLPLLRLPSASQICRVLDGQINLPLLSHALMTEASGLGGTFVRRRVTGLKVTGDTITELIIEGERCLVREGDQVILACGSASGRS